MTDSRWLDYPAQAECWTDSCFMSRETADWYSGNNTLLHSGSLWWPCCCQWQHLRQHHRDTSTNIHIFSHEHTHTHRAISYKALLYILSVCLTLPHSLFLSDIPTTHKCLLLPKDRSFWPTVIYSLLKAVVCVWDCWRLMLSCQHSAGLCARMCLDSHAWKWR